MIREVGERPAGVELVRDFACSRTWVVEVRRVEHPPCDWRTIIGWFTDAQIASGAYRRGDLPLTRSLGGAA